MRSRLVVTGFAGAVFTFAMPASGATAAGFGQTTGDVSWTTDLGYKAMAQFVAQDKTPARGTIAVTNHDNVDFIGTTSCYRQLDPNATVFGGRITRHSFADQAKGNVDHESLTYFEVQVVDNGSPGNSGATPNPDTIIMFRPRSLSCAGLTAARRIVTDGNLTVHDGG